MKTVYNLSKDESTLKTLVFRVDSSLLKCPFFRLLIFLWLICSALPTYSQEADSFLYVHPIRVDHKWGYVKIYPQIVKTKVPPRYDYLADINVPYNTLNHDGKPSPYKIFELDGKVGLLNETLEEIIAHEYNRIKVLADNFFAVTQDQTYLLRDKAGKIYFDSTYFEDICLATGGEIDETNYFFTKKNRLWGISRIPNDVELVAPKYTTIANAGHPGFYKIKKTAGKGWGLIDTMGQVLLPTEFEEVLVLNEQYTAVQKEENWLIYKNGEKELKTYRHVRKVSEQLCLLEHTVGTDAPNGPQLWNFKLDTILGTFPKKSLSNYDIYEPLAGKFAIRFPENGEKYIVNELGKRISTSFHTIKPTSKLDTYIIQYRDRVGLLSKTTRDSFISTGFDYQHISDIRNNVAIGQSNTIKYGLIGIAEDTLPTLPCIYNNEPQFVKEKIFLQFDKHTIRYTFSPDKYFVEDSVIYENGYIIPSQGKLPIKEASAIGFERYAPYFPVHYQLDKNKVQQITPKLNADGELISQVETLGTVEEKHIPKRSIEILSNFNIALYQKKKGHKKEQLLKVEAPYLRYITGGMARKINFLNLKTGKSVATPPMIGLRRFETDIQVSAFIDPTGKMGLVHQNGQEILQNGKALRYTFIGPFVAGRARVCMGGQLVFDKKEDLAMPPKFKLGNVAQLLEDFRINPSESPNFAQMQMAYFIISPSNNPARWGYIDTSGQLLIETPYEYVEDFHWKDHRALVLNSISKEVYVGTGKKEAVYGLIDLQGKVILEPTYNSIGIFKDFYLINNRNTPTFTFNQKGQEILINPTKPANFSEGLARVKNEHRLFGFIDTAGKQIIPPIYKTARDFSDGLALVTDTTEKFQFIDSKGLIAIALKVKNALLVSDFSEGLAWVKAPGKNWIWSCIKTNGQIAFPKKYFYQPTKTQADSVYRLPMSFSNGLAAVTTTDHLTHQLVSAIINRQGKPLKVFTKQLIIRPFNKLGIAVFEDQQKQGLVDSLGTILLKATYKTILPFSEHLYKVQSNNGLWGLINQQGLEIVKPRYLEIDELSEGLIAVKTNAPNGWSYINIKGQTIITNKYTVAPPFKNGLSLVTKGTEQFIIDTNGEKVSIAKNQALFHSEGILGLQKQGTHLKYFADASGANIFGRFFEDIMPYQLGIARVKRVAEEGKKEYFGAINKRGVMIVPPKFRNLHIQANGNIIINPQRYYGLLDKNGKVLLEPLYDRILQFEEFDIFRVERGESVGYMRLEDGKFVWVWDLQK